MSPREWHPDELELELSRTGEADERVGLHVDGCAACRAERDALSAMAAELAAPLPPILVPRDRAAAILRSARTAPKARAADRLARGEARRRTRWLLLAPAVAAAAVAAVVLWPRDRAADDAPRVVAPARPGDVNADGRIDVRDAYALARALDRGGAQSTWDVTGDGLVDRGDVDWIAMAAVSLGDLGKLGGAR